MQLILKPDAFAETLAALPAAEREPRLKAQLNLLLDHPHSDHLAWCQFAESQGCFTLAFREAQLAVRDQPHSAEALRRLATMLLERGDSDRAARHLESALIADPEDRETWLQLAQLYTEKGLTNSLLALETQASQKGIALPPRSGWLEAAPPEEPAPLENWPSEAAAIRFLQRFGGREDTHARQWATRDGRSGYTPVKQPLTPKRIQEHLVGNETLGVYCLRLDATVLFFALDLDINKSALEEALLSSERAQGVRDSLAGTMAAIDQACRELGLELLLENSGYKGRHFWGLLAQPLPAEIVHLLGALLMRKLQALIPGDLHLEFFPKQADLHDKKLGNLIKLPLGIHQKSGRRSVFLDREGQVIKRWAHHLAAFPEISQTQVFDLVEALKQENLPPIEPAAASQAPESAGPAPAPVNRQWTEADFEHDPQMRHLFQSCPTLRRLKQQIDEHRQLNNDEQVVLQHSLGHLQQGVQAVNYLFARCVNIPPERYLQSRLKGNPVSCAKIRKRIGHLSAQVDCNCRFYDSPGHYPTPVLHLRTLPDGVVVAQPPEPLLDLARRYMQSLRKARQVKTETENLGRQLALAIAALPERELCLPEGKYSLREQAEIDTLHWEALPAASQPTPQPTPQPDTLEEPADAPEPTHESPFSSADGS